MIERLEMQGYPVDTSNIITKVNEIIDAIQSPVQIGIEYLLNYNKDWNELEFVHVGDAGFDLRAAIEKPVTLPCVGSSGFTWMHCSWETIPTGVKFDIPRGYEVQLRPRSGLAAKYGISIVNSPGTIDADFRGELKVILINLGNTEFRVNPGDRIAQAVVSELPYRVELKKVKSVSSTVRGENGFGSSGV